jgi:hypothetical protein
MLFLKQSRLHGAILASDSLLLALIFEAEKILFDFAIKLPNDSLAACLDTIIKLPVNPDCATVIIPCVQAIWIRQYWNRALRKGFLMWIKELLMQSRYCFC